MTHGRSFIHFMLAALVVWTTACGQEDSDTSAPALSSDADSDGDGDSDGDSDMDSDADGDADMYFQYDTDDGSDTDSATGMDTDAPPVINPFVYAAHDPFSTFAADVDTASYDIFRSYLRNGAGLPEPQRVRLEEFVNYFAYDYPVPAGNAEHPFTISLAAAPGIFNQDTRLLRVGIQAEVAQMKPANVVFLIDTSGSMSGVKLTYVKRVLTQTLDLLNPGDMVSIVTYAGSAGLVLAATDVEDSADIAAAINNLEAGGSTAGSAGIDLAYEQAQAGFIEGGINHVILCTDGDFNVGPYSTTELLDQIEQKRLSGVTLAVLGIGTYVNDSMMETISNAGNGVYGVINSDEDADRYVEEEMLASINFVAKDVKIQVEFNPATVLAYRLMGYENRAIADEDFRDDTVDAGEVGSGHQVTALYELVMADGQLPACAQEVDDGEPVEGEREIGLEEVVLVKVRYKDLEATEQDPAVEVRERLLNGQVLTRLADADVDLQWAAAVAGFAEILRGSPCAASDNLDDIEGIISAENWLDDARSEFVELFGMAVDLLAP